MVCFRIDESGYTGFDLLNSEQRFQGATAIAIEDDDAAALIRHHFPAYRRRSSSTARSRADQVIIARFWRCCGIY